MVHDNCDGCETNQINLQMAPFTKLANPDLGRIKIEYREVSGGMASIPPGYCAAKYSYSYSIWSGLKSLTKTQGISQAAGLQ